ncbi:MAG: hypothetical protein ACT4PL_08745 [Phycisphaerales bacterium]
MHALMTARLAPDSSGGLPPAEAKPKITFTSGGNTTTVESQWKRPFNKDNTGATHVRTFTAKLTATSLEYLDRHINEWLDSHTDCEVKFSTMSVAEMSTSMGKEATLVVQVWI